MDKLNSMIWRRIYTHGQTQLQTMEEALLMWVNSTTQYRGGSTPGQLTTQLHDLEEDVHLLVGQGYFSALWSMQDKSLPR